MPHFRAIVEWAARRRSKGYEVILWSAQGKAHADQVVASHGLEGVFSVVISKPGYILDDVGWAWIRHTRAINLRAFEDGREHPSLELP
jgi:phosphoglycolate phosphatase-like HAD superfamily hydrolase